MLLASSPTALAATIAKAGHSPVPSSERSVEAMVASNCFPPSI